jgi:hypothetical protein
MENMSWHVSFFFEGENCLLGFFQKKKKKKKKKKTSSICAIRCFNAFHLSSLFYASQRKKEKRSNWNSIFNSINWMYSRYNLMVQKYFSCFYYSTYQIRSCTYIYLFMDKRNVKLSDFFFSLKRSTSVYIPPPFLVAN